MLLVSMLGILNTYKDRLSMLIDSNNGARAIINGTYGKICGDINGDDLVNNDDYDYYVPIIEDKNDKLYYSVFDKNKTRVLDDLYSTKEQLYETLSNYNGKILLISHKGDEYDKYDSVKEEINAININKNILVNNTEINPHTDAITVMCHVLEVKNLRRHFWTLLEIWHCLSCMNLS